MDGVPTPIDDEADIIRSVIKFSLRHDIRDIRNLSSDIPYSCCRYSMMKTKDTDTFILCVLRCGLRGGVFLVRFCLRFFFCILPLLITIIVLHSLRLRLEEEDDEDDDDDDNDIYIEDDDVVEQTNTKNNYLHLHLQLQEKVRRHIVKQVFIIIKS